MNRCRCIMVALLALAMAFLHNGAIFLFNLGFPMLGAGSVARAA